MSSHLQERKIKYLKERGGVELRGSAVVQMPDMRKAVIGALSDVHWTQGQKHIAVAAPERTFYSWNGEDEWVDTSHEIDSDYLEDDTTHIYKGVGKLVDPERIVTTSIVENLIDELQQVPHDWGFFCPDDFLDVAVTDGWNKPGKKGQDKAEALKKDLQNVICNWLDRNGLAEFYPIDDVTQLEVVVKDGSIVEEQEGES